MSPSILNIFGGRSIIQYTQLLRPGPGPFATSVKKCTKQPLGAKAMEVAKVIRKEGAARNIWILFLGFKRTNVGNLSGSLDCS